MNAELQTSII